jgi:hypothetical protein
VAEAAPATTESENHTMSCKANQPSISAAASLQHLAFSRVAGDHFFVGFALARAREAEGIDLAEQARRLGLDLDGLAKLALCRQPHRDTWEEDVRVVAEYVGLAPAMLEALLGDHTADNTNPA